MKKLLEALAILSLVVVSGPEIPDNTDGLVCSYVENEEGELELVCIPEEDAVCPLFDCPPDCWGDIL